MINCTITKSDKLQEEYAIFISFEYDYKIVDAVKALPNRFYNPDKKEWEVPLNALPILLEKLDWLEWHIESEEYIPVITESNVEIPSDFSFKTSPFEHQIEGFKYGLVHDRWLLGDEQGLGKTKQVIDIAVAKKYQKGYKHCLIICGVNGLKWNWINEIKTHSDEAGWILGQYRKNTVSGQEFAIGSNKDKLDDLNKLGSDNHLDSHYFLITNVESLRNKEIADKIQTLCKSGEIGIVAIDEIHKCKDPNSQQGKGILKVNPECKIAMTGTPLMNSPMDIYIILKWLGMETHSFFSFKNHYCVMGGYGGYQILGYRNLDELQSKVDSIMLRRCKDDVLDLPDKIHVNEYVEMGKEQLSIYKQVTDEIKDDIDQIAVSPNPLAQLIRLRQATGYPGILSSTVTQSAKLDRMDELVEEAIENNQQIVIFSNWTKITEVVFKRLSKKYKVSMITGETPDEVRQSNVTDFQEGKFDIMVGTIGAMGTGLTLTAGTVEIFLDEPWNRALKAQAEDRCHRIGQQSKVTIYTLIAKNTIDERINDIVIQKGEMSDALIDGKPNMDKRQLLDYLIS